MHNHSIEVDSATNGTGGPVFLSSFLGLHFVATLPKHLHVLDQQCFPQFRAGDETEKPWLAFSSCAIGSNLRVPTASTRALDLCVLEQRDIPAPGHVGPAEGFNPPIEPRRCTSTIAFPFLKH